MSDIVKNFFENNQDYDILVDITTVGMDSMWKQNMYSLIPQDVEIKEVLDLASGTGIVSCHLSQMFPNARITGIDITKSFLNRAERKVNRNGLKNIRFIQGNAETPSRYLEKDYEADLIISSYLLKYINAKTFIKDISKISHNKTTIILHDFTYPFDTPFVLGYEIYFSILDPLLALEENTKAYSNGALYKVIKESNWVENYTKEFRETGWKVESYPQLFKLAEILKIYKIG